MNIDDYDYLWKKGNYNYILVKGNVGYTIFDRVNNSILIIENEILNEQIVKKMLNNGNPIYESIEDLKNNREPVNRIGQPSEGEDFPIKRYKLSIRWSEEPSLIVQIKRLKDAFPAVKDRSNQELLAIARKNRIWHFDTLYLDKEKADRVLQLGKGKGLDMILELDDLKDAF